MADRDSVIEALKQAVPFMRVKGYGAVALIMLDALELLKSEPVKPVVMHSIGPTWWYACGSCEEPIGFQDRFCCHCGREVKW